MRCWPGGNQLRQVSGDSTTPSTDIISPATIFRIASPSRAPGGQPLRPFPLVLEPGTPGRDPGGESSLASFAGRVAARSQPARGAPATGHRATPRARPGARQGLAAGPAAPQAQTRTWLDRYVASAQDCPR